MDELGQSVINSLGVAGAEQLNDILTRSYTDRAELIGRLYSREDGQWLAEMLMDLEGDEGEPARLLLAESISRRLWQ